MVAGINGDRLIIGPNNTDSVMVKMLIAKMLSPVCCINIFLIIKPI